jgi:hypothetical protein
MTIKKYRSRTMKHILGAAAAALLAASSANAAFIMTLDDSSTLGIDRIVQDDTLAGVLTSSGLTTTNSDFDFGAGAGAVGYGGPIGTFLINITGGLSKPIIGEPGTMLDLFSVNVSGGTGTLTIALTDTDFFRGGAGFLNFNIGGTTDGTISAQAYMDAGNAEFGTGTLLGSMTSAGPAFSHTSAGTTVNTTDPYSLTLVATVTHDGFGISSFDANVVPEPSMLALMSLGLIGLGFAGRRKLTS